MKNAKIISQFYKDNSHRLAPGTMENYNFTLTQFFNHCALDFDQIKNSDILDWIIHLKDRGLKIGTINKMLKHLRGFYKYCLEERLVQKNPMEEVRSLKEPDQLPVYLRKNELLELKEASNHCPRDRALIETLYTTGVRRNELINIKISDINFEQRKLLIRNGKGKQDRFVLFTAECKERIKAYLKTRKHESEYLFLSKWGNPLSKPGLQGILKNYSDQLKWEKRLTPHILRHTFAAHLAQKGMPLSYIQELLGHTNIQGTKVYTELFEEARKKKYDHFL